MKERKKCQTCARPHCPQKIERLFFHSDVFIDTYTCVCVYNLDAGVDNILKFVVITKSNNMQEQLKCKREFLSVKRFKMCVNLS